MKLFPALFIMLHLLTGASSAQWTSQTSGTTNILFGVSFTDINTGTAVGEKGIILRTTNGGITWQPQVSGTTHHLVGVSFINANTGTVVGDGGTILRTTNGGTTWVLQQSGTSSLLQGVSFVDAETGTAAGIGVILNTRNGGDTWKTQLSGVSTFFVGVSFTDASTGTVVGSSGTILRTTDGGSTWIPQSSGTMNGLSAVSFPNANTGTVVGVNGRILRTTNGGDTWSSQVSETGAQLNGVSFINSNTGITAGYSGVIRKTTDGGNTWTVQASGTANALVGVSFPDLNIGWVVGVFGTILRYTGQVPSEPENLELEVIDIGVVQLSWVSASGNENGFVLERKDNIDTNRLIIDTIQTGTNEYIDSGLIPGKEYTWRVYAYNSIGNSPYSNEVSTLITSLIIGENEIPENYILHQNYPNPFNPETRISFELPSEEYVQLVIYDAIGREVTYLVKDIMQQGKHEVIWNAGTLSGGVYFYKFEAGSFSDIKKMVLLK